MDDLFLNKKKILIVDDEPELLELVTKIFKDSGFDNIVTASNVKEGTAICQCDHPDLILLDVMLPDGDGFSLMQQIRLFTDVPVIFLTAKDHASNKLAGLSLGADDYMIKPFMPQELLLRIYAGGYADRISSDIHIGAKIREEAKIIKNKAERSKNLYRILI